MVRDFRSAIEHQIQFACWIFSEKKVEETPPRKPQTRCANEEESNPPSNIKSTPFDLFDRSEELRSVYLFATERRGARMIDGDIFDQPMRAAIPSSGFARFRAVAW